LEDEYFIRNQIKIYPWPMHLPGLGIGHHIKTIQVDQNDEWIFLGMTSGCIKVYNLGMLVGSSEKLFGFNEGFLPGSVYSENISPDKPSKSQIFETLEQSGHELTHYEWETIHHGTINCLLVPLSNKYLFSASDDK
jgi:hypothetical protein